MLYCPTAQMAKFMLLNVAYRATVYRTGVGGIVYESLHENYKESQKWLFSMQKTQNIPSLFSYHFLHFFTKGGNWFIKKIIHKPETIWLYFATGFTTYCHY